MHCRARKQILRERSYGLCINTLEVTLLSRLAAKAVDITTYVYNNSLVASRNFGYYNKLIAVLLRMFLHNSLYSY
jgi:hypothetical protein